MKSMVGAPLSPRVHAIARRIVLAVIALTVCAAAFNGFYQKWGFREGADTRFTAQAYFDGTGARPFAYRRLMPDVVNFMASESHAPTEQERAVEVYKEKISILTVLTLIGIIFFFVGAYLLVLEHGGSAVQAYVAACATVLIFPVLQIGGGYFYDFAELAFFCLFMVYAARGRIDFMLILALLGTWNKESFLFFIVAASPFAFERMRSGKAVLATLGSLAVSAATYLVIRERFAELPGATAEIHLAEQIAFFLRIGNLVRFETVYSLGLPHLFSIFGLVSAVCLVVAGGQALGRATRRYAALAAAINIPLFLLFCSPGETRNLSMLFPLIPVLVAGTFGAVAMRREGQAAMSAPSSEALAEPARDRAA